jgi:hypothetical protein
VCLCPECGSRYAVGQFVSVERRQGLIACYVCDKTLVAFNDWVVPVLALMYAAPWPWAPDIKSVTITSSR